MCGLLLRGVRLLSERKFPLGTNQFVVDLDKYFVRFDGLGFVDMDSLNTMSD
jgi:hypothetical protein